VLRTAATAGLLGWLVLKIDWATIGRQLGSLQVCWLLLALAMPAGALYLMSLRWTKIVNLLGLPMEQPELLRLTLVGQFFNSFLPGATGGDLYKISTICGQLSCQKALAASSVLIDRVFATVALLIVGLSSFLGLRSLWLSILGNGNRVPSVAFLLVLAAVLAASVLLLVLLLRGAFSASLSEKIRNTLTTLRHSGLHDRRAVVTLSLSSLVIHLLNFSGAYFLTRALSVEVSYPQMMALMPVLLLAVLLPLSINGHGIREVVIIGYFTILDIHGQPGASPREISVAFSMLYVAMDSFWCLPGAAIFLLRRTKSK